MSHRFGRRIEVVSANVSSFRMLVILASGLALWIIYGALSRSTPIVIANAAGLVLVVALITMKWIFDPTPTKE
jgi:uncharacterized protein with PQ loop repeat